MNDVITTSYSLCTSQTDTKCTCRLIECTGKRIGANYQYAITDIVVYQRGVMNGYRRFSVALPAGISLYHYLSSGGRKNRIKEIMFELNVIAETQRVTSIKAYDPLGWVNGDIVHERRG